MDLPLDLVIEIFGYLPGVDLKYALPACFIPPKPRPSGDLLTMLRVLRSLRFSIYFFYLLVIAAAISLGLL